MHANPRVLSLTAVFAVVVKCSRFTRAALQLGISKSVVSRAVSRLEKELGIQLLYRSTDSLSLTETGERLFAQRKDCADIAEQAKAAAAEIQQSPLGLLRITTQQSLAESPVGGLVALFQVGVPIDISMHGNCFRIHCKST